MTLELTMQAMFDHYPSLFKDRADCLNHLFCTIGNGYSWEGGELVSGDDGYVPVNPLKDGRAFQYNLLSLRDEAIAAAERMRRENHRFAGRVDPSRVPDDQYHRRPRALRWYFIHYADTDGTTVIDLCKDYAKLWNFPADIRPDWEAGRQECLAMLREDGIIPTEHEKEEQTCTSTT